MSMYGTDYRPTLDILNEVNSFTAKQDKINHLQANGTVPLKTFLMLAYSSDITFLLPKERPEFRLNHHPDTVIDMHVNTFKMFIKECDEYPNLKQTKRERKFIDLLESVSPDEAEFIMQVCIDRKVRGITRTVVREAFPSLLGDSEK